MFGFESIDWASVVGGTGAAGGLAMLVRSYLPKLRAQFSGGEGQDVDAADLAAFTRLKLRAGRSSSDELKDAVKDVGTHFFD